MGLKCGIASFNVTFCLSQESCNDKIALLKKTLKKKIILKAHKWNGTDS
jgi:hypothetical protein